MYTNSNQESVWIGLSVDFVGGSMGFSSLMVELEEFFNNKISYNLGSSFYFYLFYMFQFSWIDSFLFIFWYSLFNLMVSFLLKFSEVTLIYILFGCWDYDLMSINGGSDLSLLFNVFSFRSNNNNSVGVMSVSIGNLSNVDSFENLSSGMFFLDGIKSYVSVINLILSFEFNFTLKVSIGFFFSFLDCMLDFFSLNLEDVYTFFLPYYELFLFNFWCLISCMWSFFESFNFYIYNYNILIPVYFFDCCFRFSYHKLFKFFLKSNGIMYPNIYLVIMYFNTCFFSMIIVCFFFYNLNIFLGIFYKLVCFIQIFNLFPVFVFLESFYFFLNCFLVFSCSMFTLLVVDFLFIFILMFF